MADSYRPSRDASRAVDDDGPIITHQRRVNELVEEELGNPNLARKHRIIPADYWNTDSISVHGPGLPQVARNDVVSCWKGPNNNAPMEHIGHLKRKQNEHTLNWFAKDPEKNTVSYVAKVLADRRAMVALLDTMMKVVDDNGGAVVNVKFEIETPEIAHRMHARFGRSAGKGRTRSMSPPRARGIEGARSRSPLQVRSSRNTPVPVVKMLGHHTITGNYATDHESEAGDR